MGPSRGVLLMQRPVGVCNGSWLQEEAVRGVWHPGFASGQLHHAINVHMRNVYLLQQQTTELLQALSTKTESPVGERRGPSSV